MIEQNQRFHLSHEIYLQKKLKSIKKVYITYYLLGVERTEDKYPVKIGFQAICFSVVLQYDVLNILYYQSL